MVRTLKAMRMEWVVEIMGVSRMWGGGENNRGGENFWGVVNVRGGKKFGVGEDNRGGSKVGVVRMMEVARMLWW